MEQQTAPVKKQRILSGIQPSGTPTLGNYIGAMRNWKLLEDQYGEAARAVHPASGAAAGHRP